MNIRKSEPSLEIKETEFAELYDEMLKSMRDKGWLNLQLLKEKCAGHSKFLEIGSGPGYIGLEIIKQQDDAMLTGVDISEEMITIAKRNAKKYALQNRVKYIKEDAQLLPFHDNEFDFVFSYRSLHEWRNPIVVFKEIKRVLKGNGSFYILDLKRDIHPKIKQTVLEKTFPAELRKSFLDSVNASYTISEIKELLSNSGIEEYSVVEEPIYVHINGTINPLN